MSEVKRLVTRYSRDFDGNLSVDPNGSWVLAADAAMHAKKLTDELAALREELAESGRADHLRQRIAFLTTEIHKQAERLTAAEQRNSTLTALLREVSESLWQEDDSGDLFERIDEALAQPTESGASE